MATSSSFPLALKVFFLSLFAGVGGGYGAFKLGVFLVMKYWKGDNLDTIAVLAGMAAALIVGVCSAVTAGVLAGRVTRA
jgi:hypothetical protein